MIAADNTLANKYAEDFIEYTKQDLLHVAQTYMRICFRLYEADKNEYYVSLGYPDIYSCAEELLDLSKSTVSRMISVCRRFSRLNGYNPSMFIGDKYKKYNFSQLCEMVTMKDEDLKLINSDMTVREIRDAKNRIRNKYHEACVDAAKKVFESRQNAVATSQQTYGDKMRSEGFHNVHDEKPDHACLCLVVDRKGHRFFSYYNENELGTWQWSCENSRGYDFCWWSEVVADEEFNENNTGCDEISDSEICEETVTEVIEDKLPEVTRRDINEMVRDFMELGYAWIEFPDDDKIYYRFDTDNYSFIICYEDGISGKAIDSYHILAAGPKRCFNYNLTLTSRDFFIDTFLKALNGEIDE